MQTCHFSRYSDLSHVPRSQIRRLSQAGGRDAKKFIANCLRMLMSDEVAARVVCKGEGRTMKKLNFTGMGFFSILNGKSCAENLPFSLNIPVSCNNVIFLF